MVTVYHRIQQEVCTYTIHHNAIRKYIPLSDLITMLSQGIPYPGLPTQKYRFSLAYMRARYLCFHIAIHWPILLGSINLYFLAVAIRLVLGSS